MQVVVHVKLKATYTFLCVDYQAFVMQKCKMQAKVQADFSITYTT